MKSNPSRASGSNGRAKKRSLPGAVVSWALTIAGGLALGVVIGQFVVGPKPVAALGLSVCGKVQAVTIVMSDGKMKRFEGPSKEGSTLIRKVPDKNFSDYAVQGPFCSPPKAY